MLSFSDGWHLALSGENCNDTCSRQGLKCSKDEFHQHNKDIDSSVELLSLIKRVGGKTSAKRCSSRYGSGGAVPNFTPSSCYHSDSSRSVSTFDCGRKTSQDLNKWRLCWCHSSGKLDITTNNAVPICY